jgi:hypothetical protein
VEQRILAFALAQPGLGPKRISAELARERWGGLRISANGVWRVLCRHGLNTRSRRPQLMAGYAARYERARLPRQARHLKAERPHQLVGLDCFYVGRLSGSKGTVWQYTAIDVASSFAWGRATRLAAQPARRALPLARRARGPRACPGRLALAVLQMRSASFAAAMRRWSACAKQRRSRRLPLSWRSLCQGQVLGGPSLQRDQPRRCRRA